jgi:hypothetical protein
MLGAQRYAEAFDAGHQLTLDQAVALFVRVQEETWGSGDPESDHRARLDDA